MAKMRSFFEDIDKEEFIELTYRLSANDIAKHYGINLRTVFTWKNNIRNMGKDVGEGGIPISETEDYTAHEVVTAERAIVVSDVEFPDQDAEMLGIMLAMAQRFKIKILIIAGDFIALDSFSTWAKSAAYTLAFKQELDPAKEALRVFFKWFDEIIYISGNHDRRLNHKIDGEITIGDFLTDFAGLRCSEYTHCVLNSGDREIFIVHPKNYRDHPLSLPSRMASKKLMCVIAGHTHHLAIGYDVSGTFWVAESGCCRDKNKTHYKNTRQTTHTEWNPGFLMVIEGNPFMIDKNNYLIWASMKMEG